MTTKPFSFNPLEPPHLENPYPLYARAQREAPIFFSPLFATWVVTRYENVRAILHDPRRFSSSYLFRTPVDPTPEVLEVLAHLPPEVGVLVNEDPPGHRRDQRRLGGRHRGRRSGQHLRRRSLPPRLAQVHAQEVARAKTAQHYWPLRRA